jgi:hypothetical protein
MLKLIKFHPKSSSKTTNYRLDTHRRTRVNKSKFGDSSRTLDGESEFKSTTREGAGIIRVVEGVQKCFVWTYKDLKCIPIELGSIYLENNAIWNEKWTFNISESGHKSIQRICRYFYENSFG